MRQWGFRGIAAYEINQEEQTLPLEELRRIVELVRGGGVSEISVRRGELEITVRAAQGPVEVEASKTVEVTDEVFEEGPEEGDGEQGTGLHEVRSPVVGTFYRAPAPGEANYVEIGDEVGEGQTLCIVEAMKLMNEIPSDAGGEVVEVLVDNGDGVQYDQPLFLIRPGA